MIIKMGDIQWVMRSIFIALLNDTTTWIMAIILVVAILNIILGVFHENNK